MAFKLLVLLSVAFLVVSSNKYTENHNDKEEGDSISKENTCSKDEGCTEQSRDKTADEVENTQQVTELDQEKNQEPETIKSEDKDATEETKGEDLTR